MIRYLFSAIVILGVLGCTSYKPNNSKSRTTLAFIGYEGIESTTNFPLGEQQLHTGIGDDGVRKYCAQKRIIRKPSTAERLSTERVAPLETLFGGIVQTITTIFASELQNSISEALNSRAKRFTQTYVASWNFPSFSLGRNTSNVRCIGVLRVIDTPTGDAVASSIVLELESFPGGAMVIRPLYINVPRSLAETGVKKDEIGIVDIAVSVGLKTILPDGKVATHSETFSVRNFQTSVSSSTSKDFIPSTLEKQHKSRTIVPKGAFDQRNDSALLPYFAGRPATLTIAVTEIGRGAARAKRSAEIVDNNKKLIIDTIKTVFEDSVD